MGPPPGNMTTDGSKACSAVLVVGGAGGSSGEADGYEDGEKASSVPEPDAVFSRVRPGGTGMLCTLVACVGGGRASSRCRGMVVAARGGEPVVP